MPPASWATYLDRRAWPQGGDALSRQLPQSQQLVLESVSESLMKPGPQRYGFVGGLRLCRVTKRTSVPPRPEPSEKPLPKIRFLEPEEAQQIAFIGGAQAAAAVRKRDDARKNGPATGRLLSDSSPIG